MDNSWRAHRSPLVEILVSFSFGNEQRGLGGVNEAERISAAERAQRRAAGRVARSSQLANQQPQRHGVNEPSRIVIPFILAFASFSYLEHVFVLFFLLECMERFYFQPGTNYISLSRL